MQAAVQQERAFAFKPEPRENRKKYDNRKSPKIIININQMKEDAKYDGPPLIDPQIPHPYKVKEFKVDKSLPIYSRFAHWVSFATERTIAYTLDLICLRRDPVIFKTTAFIRRNFHRVRSTLAHIWLELKHVGHGFKKLKNDCMFVLGFHRQGYQTKYSTPMYFEKQKVK